MGNIITAIEFLNAPVTIAIIVVGLLLILQIIGEISEFLGKTVPEFMKVRKYFKRKKQEREEASQTLKEVKQLLNHVDSHYSADNITKRDSWMQWVNDRAVTYDTFIKEIGEKFADVTEALKNNTKMTEDMFVENSRDRIIDFAEKASDYNVVLSHEQFRRIFRVHECYEQFLEDHNRTNGEIDIAYEMIQDGFKYRIQNHCFAEDLNGYIKK